MKLFEKVYIELSDYCALSCGFCPSHTLSKRRGIMDLALFESICAQIEGKTRRVCLHLLGDPLSVQHFEMYVKILKNYHLKVDLVTTGLFLRKKHFELLTQEPFVQVSFSLSAFLANPHQLKKAHLRRILDFCAFNIHLQSPIFVNLRFHSNDISHQEKYFVQMLSEIGAYFDLSDITLGQERVKLGKKVFLNPTHSFDWEIQKDTFAPLATLDNTSSQYSAKPLCYGAQKQIGILSNGELVPCCIDYNAQASFGNLKEQSLVDILDSQAFVEFALSLQKGHIPCELCRKCGYRLILQ
ncbi:radical SAM/SPASM domain-containing protein [Helicobacter sp. MIT 21-1697]|uniref:radical SAM/SPASM domain-containing protein n=1 Tax=Helicobacter sp. MIT 21-1697 TaxID=2993733 RepID=UPI00224B8FD9|nr:radical SAM/SPASM domain-containing protein [Helicobacter sp. MIT 21-1697]MCX2716709.1 radical SAM/SPASM domain-containing protein [Helicobacter sp. MIT 21-1697]